MPTHDQKDQKLKVVELVREAIKQDEELRKTYKIDNKFRFIRDRLRALLERLEKKHQEVIVEESKETKTVNDEVIVYVYLYNAHGMNITSWQNMLIPKVFYEYSVNRPIYAEKSAIQALLRTKKNRLQHAFLSIAIKRTDLVQPTNGSGLKDAAGNQLVRVREGALSFEKLIEFNHNNIEYILGEEGELIKK